MEGSTMTLCIWTLYDFDSFISKQIPTFTMITILCVLFGRDQNKRDLEKEDTERLDMRLETIKQSLKESLNQNRKPSKESNLELTITSKTVVPDIKVPQGLKKLESSPQRCNILNLRIQILVIDLNFKDTPWIVCFIP